MNRLIPVVLTSGTTSCQVSDPPRRPPLRLLHRYRTHNIETQLRAFSLKFRLHIEADALRELAVPKVRMKLYDQRRCNAADRLHQSSYHFFHQSVVAVV